MSILEELDYYIYIFFKIMIFHPIHYISRFVIITTIRLLRVNSPQMITLITGLFSLSTNLISTVDIIPVFRVLHRLLKIIRTNPNVINSISSLYGLFYPSRYNPFVVRQILDFMIPLSDCLNPLPKKFNYIYYILLSFLSLGLSKSLTTILFRNMFGLVLGSLGILWDTSFNSISVLHDIASSVIDFTENNFNFKFPRLDRTDVITSVNETIEDSVNNNGYTWLTIIGIAMITVTGAIAGLLITEHYSPDTIQNIPVINTFVDSLHIGWDYIISYFKTGGSDPSNDSTNVIHSPKPLSRTSSGSSSILSDTTITPDIRTPRVELSNWPTPPSTPEPQINIPNNWE